MGDDFTLFKLCLTLIAYSLFQPWQTVNTTDMVDTSVLVDVSRGAWWRVGMFPVPVLHQRINIMYDLQSSHTAIKHTFV